MIFGLRIFAYRVVERAGYRVPTPLGAALVQLLVAEAKADRKRTKGGNLLHIVNAAQALQHDLPSLHGLMRLPGCDVDTASRVARAAKELYQRAQVVGEISA